MEIWKDIKGYEGYYKISNKGKIKSIERIVKYRDSFKKYPGREMNIHENWNGYNFVVLSKNGKKNNKLVHRLLAEHFIDNPEKKPYVNHLDGIRKNNDLKNLEWCTAKENTQHAMKVTFNIKSCYIHKEEIIKKYVEKGQTVSELALYYKSDKRSISRLLRENGVEVKTSAQQKTKYKVNAKDFFKNVEKGLSNKQLADLYNVPTFIINNWKRRLKK